MGIAFLYIFLVGKRISNMHNTAADIYNQSLPSCGRRCNHCTLSRSCPTTIGAVSHGLHVTSNLRRRPLYSAKGLAVMNLFVNACGLFNTYLPPVAIGNVGWR